MEEQARGWSDPGTFVCDQCVHDPYLAELVRDQAVERRCDYCDRRARKAIAAPASAVLDVIGRAIRIYYNDPTDAGVPYDEGLLVEPDDTNEVLQDLCLACSDAFFEGVCGAFGGSMWVPAARGHWSSSQLSDRMRDSWSSFEWLVKHQTRYHFAQQQPSDFQELSPTQLLVAIGSAATSLGVVQRLAQGTVLYRARVRHPGSEWTPDAKTMGAPPYRLASAGRMNPPGISYFYAALERETAVGELAPAPPIELAAAEFVLRRDVQVLNLCDLPPGPSIFDTDRNDELQWLGFLRGFSEAISQPVAKDGGEHIDYVPSQVVCEWFAQVYGASEEGARLDGILYSSAVVPGGRNLVLFPERERWAEAKFDAIEFRSYELLTLGNWAQLAEALGFVRGGAVQVRQRHGGSAR